MKLNPADFDKFLSSAGGIGQDMLWRRSSSCPCFNIASGSAKANCQHCLGKGRLWAKSVRCRAGVASQSVMRNWAQFGQYESGDAVVVVPQNSPLYEAGQFDRVTMLNGQDRFSQVFVRGDNDRMRIPVKVVTRVFWFNGAATIEGGIPKVDARGELTWLSGEPPLGVQYSIEGSAFSEYYVFGPMPSDRSEHFGARLPTKLVLRKFDLFGR